MLDTMYHKSLVINACIKMANYLFENDKVDLGLLLLQRANIHDNSKLVGPELELLSSLSEDKAGFTDPSIQLTSQQKKIIEYHWANNRHHPEYFKDVSEMSELDILEMVCDWYARSEQYATDFLSFVVSRQENRFHFPAEMFEKIYNYCVILNKQE